MQTVTISVKMTKFILLFANHTEDRKKKKTETEKKMSKINIKITLFGNNYLKVK